MIGDGKGKIFLSVVDANEHASNWTPKETHLSKILLNYFKIAQYQSVKIYIYVISIDRDGKIGR